MAARHPHVHAQFSPAAAGRSWMGEQWLAGATPNQPRGT
jgi:hypothetical protein